MSTYDDAYKTIIVDVDGVLVHWSPTEPDHIKGEVDGAKAMLMRLRRMGLTIHLYTARPVEEKESLSRALRERGFVFDFLTCGKPCGFAYIDDRAVRFNGWESAMKWVNTLQRGKFTHETGGTQC